MRRRDVLADWARAGFGIVTLGLLAPASLAQRPAHPINRPRPPRPDRPAVPGRFYPEAAGAVAAAPQAGMFTVQAVNARANTVQLRDDGGRSAEVYVEPGFFDLGTLQAGDQVEVDFFVPEAGDERLEAAGIWKLEPAKR